MSTAEVVTLREHVARDRGYLKSLAAEAIGTWVAIMRDPKASHADRSTAAKHLMDTITGAEHVVLSNRNIP